MKSKPKKPATVVQLPPDWRSAFQGHAMRTSFCLALSQPMLEFLCAVADGVHWDRYLYSRSFGVARPDNWIASSQSLVKRGLVERLSRAVIDAATVGKMGSTEEFAQVSHYRLTPAGAALVELLKVAGIFIEADSAIEKRAARS